VKTFLALIAAGLLSAPASAEPLAAAFSEVMEPRQVVSLRDVDACFERGADAVADLLGLPARFCVKRVGTTLPENALTPFEWNGYGIVEGAPAAGARKHISGGARRSDGGWDIVVDLFAAPGRKPRCGSLDHAFAAIYFSVDAVGRPLPGPVEVRGFMTDSSPRCPGYARAVQLDYRRVP
jgi:hypothetical protein